MADTNVQTPFFVEFLQKEEVPPIVPHRSLKFPSDTDED